MSFAHQLKFTDGFENSSHTERLIACYTHLIDHYFLSLEVVPEVVSDDENVMYTPRHVLLITGSDSIESYLGAARAGFQVMLQNLPDGVRMPVEQYLADRITVFRSLVPEDVADADVLVGTTNPYV